MKIRVPVIIKDPEVAAYKELRSYWEEIIIEEDVFLAGPVSRRVAVIDFDENGKAAEPTPLEPPTADKMGRYQYASRRGDPDALSDWGFMRAAVFGGVYKTLNMFEEKDTLGRKVSWAFNGPQLLVVPRAGEWANAFYERDTRSLQFFYFTTNGKRVYTSHSQDIIGHETAHAVIDGVLPDLYDAVTPESLALHEGLADIATVLLAFRSRALSNRVLQQTNGSIEHSSAFTQVAEQFGYAISNTHREVLRDLRNDLRMVEGDVDLAEPHSLSQVLSGALYEVAFRLHEDLKRPPRAPERPSADLAVVHSELEQWNKQSDSEEATNPTAHASPASGMPAGQALFLAGERFKRMAFRGLDYLPPGDASFADYARAVIASDMVSHPDSASQREWFIEALARRKVIRSTDELKGREDLDALDMRNLDLAGLRDSDWSAYGFVDAHRDWLGVPKGIPFEVRPRLFVEKKYYRRGQDDEMIRELILKVSWTDLESQEIAAGAPSKRRVRKGTTLVIDWDERVVRGLLSIATDRERTRSRDRLIKSLMDRDLLRVGSAARGPDGHSLRSVIPCDITDGVLKVSGAARLLHMVEGM